VAPKPSALHVTSRSSQGAYAYLPFATYERLTIAGLTNRSVLAAERRPLLGSGSEGQCRPEVVGCLFVHVREACTELDVHLWCRCLSSCAGSVYEVSPALVWAGLVVSLTWDASLRGISAKSREIAHASAPRKATHLTLGDA